MNENDWFINVDEDDVDVDEDVANWVVNVDNYVANMEDCCKELEQRGKRCMYKVPEYISEIDKEACKPQMVSFGPYHHGEGNLKSMEKHKYRALRHFLKRSKKSAKFYRDALAKEVKDLKDVYGHLDPVWLEDDEKFLKMMIIDGCFILEILRVFTSPSNDYCPKDPIFSYHGKLNTLPLIRRDMLLLENQVPLRVLEILVAVEGEHVKTGDYDLIKCILQFFNLDTRSQSIDNGLHVLNVYRRGLVSTMDKRKSMIKGKYDIIPSATELYEAGIRFKKSRNRSLKAIRCEGRTLFFRPIVGKEDTKSLFLNLMAFEKMHVGSVNEVTSYVFFMGCLIKKSEDVNLLRKHGFVPSALGSDEDAAQWFRLISKDALLDPKSVVVEVFHLVTKKLENRFKTRLGAWSLDLHQNYFKSPWKVLSVIAAIILFTLTTIQTLYAALSYNHTK